MENIKIRELLPNDRTGINKLTGRVEQFSPEERNCALELVDISLRQQEDEKEYEFLVAFEQNRRDHILGFISFGDIPLTEGCFDLYWIACDPGQQNKGIGKKLLEKMEGILRKRQARKVFAETSSLDHYQSARLFYKHTGFYQVARIPDFYKKGDDKLIYEKML